MQQNMIKYWMLVALGSYDYWDWVDYWGTLLMGAVGCWLLALGSHGYRDSLNYLGTLAKSQKLKAKRGAVGC